jgi:hypothetical protein
MSRTNMQALACSMRFLHSKIPNQEVSIAAKISCHSENRNSLAALPAGH